MKGEFPQEFRERIGNQGYIDREALLSALSSNSDVSIRVNRSKWDGNPPDADRVPWCETGFYLEKRPSFTLDPLFHAGCYYVQESSSMFLEQVIRQINGDRPGLRILDLCAAPGGKTTHLASLAGKGTVIVANEVIKQRASVLAENVVKWGTGNIVVTSSDPTAFARLPGYFDIVLVDAPCSGEGMFRDLNSRDEWSLNNCNLCAGRQQRILADVWPALKHGGHLIYSTCTFNPDENESNVKWLIENQGAASIRIDTSGFDGIVEIGDDDFMGYGFHPGKIRGQGFFIAAARKSEESVISDTGRRAFKPGRPIKGVPSRVIEMIDKGGGSLFMSGDYYYHSPLTDDEIGLLKEKLHLIRVGTQICQMKHESIIPSHEFSLSTLMKEGVFPNVEVAYSDAIRYLRKDTLNVRNDMPAGWFLLTFSGVRLGFMNNIGSRLNNYFPASLRIRMDASGTEARVLI